MSVDSSIVNERFVELIRSPEGITKAAAAGASYIRTRLRELSFARKVLPPITATKEDCQRSTDHDALTIIKDIEGDAGAYAVSIRADAPAQYFEGTRFEMAFVKYESDEINKKETELLAYDYPVTKILEDTCVKAIQEQEDVRFIAMCDVAVAASGNNILLVDTTFTRNVIRQAYKLLAADRLRLAKLIVRDDDFADVMTWTAGDVGDSIAAAITKDGWTEGSLVGKGLISTVKTNVVTAKRIYGFVDPQFLGYIYLLNQTHLWVDVTKDNIILQAWELMAQGIGNANGVCTVNLS